MKTKNISTIKLLILAILFISSVLAAKQKIIKFAGNNASMQERFDWAINQASDLDAYWVGYQFERMMSENSQIGSWSSDEDENRPSLASLLGEPEPERFEDWTFGKTAQMALRGLMERQGKKEPLKVKRKIAILLRYQRHSSTPRELATVDISNTFLRVELKGKPLYWLGDCTQEQSLGLLKQAMEEDPTNKRREELVTAFAMHSELPQLETELHTIATQDKSDDVRENAVFWMGQLDSPKALGLLKKIVEEDRSGDVREKAVFSISQMHSEEALNTLISLAKTHRDPEVREKAIFWLSQKASSKAAETLEEITYSADEIEVKEKAVFALSQRDDDQAVPKLIEIAREHPSNQIRRKAIFWLGQSEDPRAVEALIDLAK
ncbi:MAG: HEAT repeat domain-containing protein [Calditrichia bacterium]